MASPTGIGIERIDHLVLTVRDLDATLDFYGRVLGMEVVWFGEGRVALLFGTQKLNVHVAGREIAPHAATPTPGSTDVCLIVRTPIDEVVRRLGSWAWRWSSDRSSVTGRPVRYGRSTCATPTGTSSSSRTRRSRPLQAACQPGFLWEWQIPG